MVSEQHIELKLLRRYRLVAFMLFFIRHFFNKPRFESWAERILKSGMRYKVGNDDKWKRVW